VFPNITIALRVFINLSASVALGECTFNVLKQVKNYYHSTMGQDHLNGFVTLDINFDLARKLDFSSVINAFSGNRLDERLLHKIFSLLN
jgi:hypothetical protein